MMLSIYIAAYLDELQFIYPNTYVVELGKNTHEIDIFFSIDGQSQFHMIETTRGFDKIIDNTHGASFNWHFKKAVFRKWALEKLYDIECPLLYLSIKSHLIDEEEEDPSSTDLFFVRNIIDNCAGIKEISLTEDYISGSYNEIKSLLIEHLLPQINEWLEETT